MTALDLKAIPELEQDTAAGLQGDSSRLWLTSLPTLLRGIGAAAVLFSLYIFLLKGWAGSSDLIRYLMLLAHTGVLAAAGLASGHYLKEGKGARLLLTLGVVSVAANFAILGAFIFSANADVNASGYPQYLAWSVDSIVTALVVTVGALVLLLPTVAIGFRTLVRGISVRLGVLYMISNIALLLPVRDPLLVGIMALLLGAYVVGVTARTTIEHIESQTREGMIALILQFIPLGILLGRNIWLYAPDAFLFTALAAVVFVGLRQCTLLMKPDSGLRFFVEMGSLGAAMTTGGSALVALDNAGVGTPVSMIIASLIAGGMCYEISLRGRSNPCYRVLASSIVTTGMISNLFLFGGLIAAAGAVTIGIATIVLSYGLRQRSLFLGGLIMTLAGIVEQSVRIFVIFDFGYWIALAAIGIAAILVGSMLESKRGRLKHMFTRLKGNYGAWSV